MFGVAQCCKFKLILEARMQNRGAEIAIGALLAGYGLYSYFIPTSEAKFRSKLQNFCEEIKCKIKFSTQELFALYELNNQAIDINERCRQAIVRRQCLDLLLNKENIETNHNIFTGSQDRKDYLKLEQFREFSDFYISLPPPAKEALKVACLIPLNEYKKFSNLLITMLNNLQQQFLPFCFSELNLYKVLHNEIKNEEILNAFPTRNKDDIELWFARSVLELAALNATQFPLGANYLNHPRVCCLLILKKELNNLAVKEKYDVMYYYSKYKGKLDIEDKEVVAKLTH